MSLRILIESCHYSPTDNCINHLADIMRHTVTREEIILLSEFFKEKGNKQSYESLIFHLKREEVRSSDLSIHLLYALESYDCTDDFLIFADIVANGSCHEAWYALDVIGNMEGPFTKKELQVGFQLLAEINNNPEKIELLEKYNYKDWLIKKIEDSR